MKRWMGWLLALALVVGVGAACSDDEGGDADDGASSEESDSGEISAEAQGICDELQGFEEELQQGSTDGDTEAVSATSAEEAAYYDDVVAPALDDLGEDDTVAVNDCVTAWNETLATVSEELGLTVDPNTQE